MFNCVEVKRDTYSFPQCDLLKIKSVATVYIVTLPFIMSPETQLHLVRSINKTSPISVRNALLLILLSNVVLYFSSVFPTFMAGIR